MSTGSLKYDQITTDAALRDFCQAAAGAARVAFDTEFVSEDTYRPQLCLIQVAIDGRLAVIDPQEIGDITPFWRLLTDHDSETIVHAGREELRFCLAATGEAPRRMFDLQIAAGLIGLEYPASLKNLVQRLVGEEVPKGETRTDWRMRPLTRRQLDYAVRDVIHLEAVRDKIGARLARLGRLEWLDDEMRDWIEAIRASEAQPRWRRVSGVNGLSARSLAIIRALWHWREEEAASRDRPARRILRDDLLVELAKRQTADATRIRAVRGLVRGDLKKQLPVIAEVIQQALDLPESRLPDPVGRDPSQRFAGLAQFINTVVGSSCRAANLAPSLVATVQDVRELIAYRLCGAGSDRSPALARGWREEVIGRLVDDLIEGHASVRVKNAFADDPLEIVRDPDAPEL